MKQKFLAIANFGIKPETPAEIAEQTRLVNVISSTGIPICLTYVLIFGLTGFYPLALSFAIGVVIFTLPLFLNKWIGLTVGRTFVNVLAPVLFGTVSVVTGKDAGFYLGFLVITVPPLIVYSSIRTSILFICYSLCIMMASIYGNSIIAPVCKIPWVMGIYLFNLFTVMLTTLTVVFLFKRELSESRTILSEKQKEIIDSIRYAKRIQQTLMPTEKYIEKTLKQLNKS